MWSFFRFHEINILTAKFLYLILCLTLTSVLLSYVLFLPPVAAIHFSWLSPPLIAQVLQISVLLWLCQSPLVLLNPMGGLMNTPPSKYSVAHSPLILEPSPFFSYLCHCSTGLLSLEGELPWTFYIICSNKTHSISVVVEVFP